MTSIKVSLLQGYPSPTSRHLQHLQRSQMFTPDTRSGPTSGKRKAMSFLTLDLSLLKKPTIARLMIEIF